ncbi:MAG: HAMP domain-containing sensor histidine kinase [Actinomycetota bacterium]
MILPRWAQSIRFRLALVYALAVFAAGSVLLAALYLWQVRQLNEPILVKSRPAMVQLADGVFADVQFVSQDDLAMAFLERFEREAYGEALDAQRKASLTALGVLVVVAFTSGWVLSGWTLRPMRQIAGVARDITGNELSRRIELKGPDDELKDLADTFDEMLDRLQASFEDQRRFVQDTSHELRNPLAVTRTNLELVLDDPEADAPELREAARIAHDATERVSQIVDQLVAQARDGVPTGLSGDVDVSALALGIVEDQRASAAARDLHLAVTVDGAVHVHGDGPAIRRAVTNLVANAVRLAPADTTITVAVDTEADWARVRVIDQGPGVAPENVDRVFERFWRGPDSGKGLGLGLSIVRQVAERHGGRVDLASEVDIGSTFTIRLPRTVREARPMSQSDA